MPAQATSIRLLDFRSPPMRTFHMTWFAFFTCFFAWFGIAPLMPIVREELQLTPEQIGWSIIASVSVTVFARLAIGRLCDRLGPRVTYTGLLVVGSLPVMGIGLADDFASFLIFRLLIGIIGASFVITQYHTSRMFAANVVGTANATTAGWGNMGGGATQIAMPLVFAALVGTFGLTDAAAWRTAMIVAGAVCMTMGVAYYFLTQDTPAGNFREIRAVRSAAKREHTGGSFLQACADRRVWVLFLIYAACFGMELTINNIAALYFVDYFGLGLTTAGIVAGSFGLMNLFARTLGGAFGDRFGIRGGLRGRVRWLFVVLLGEGLALMLFSQMTILPLAVATLVVFSLFVQMSEGATFSVVPFINRKNLGSVAGIVGAGGNVGAVASGFLFKSQIPWPTALLILGAVVTCASFLVWLVQFSEAAETEAAQELARGREKSASLRPAASI